MQRLSRSLAAMLALALAICALPAAAGGMSDYLENKLADHVFRATAFTAPSTLCAALATGAPTDATTGATLTEANYGGYQRAPLNPSVSNWKGTGNEISGASAGTSGTVKAATQLCFGSSCVATASSAQTGQITHFAVLDSCTVGAGNVLFYGTLTAAKTVNNGDPVPNFPADALTYQIDN